MKAVIEEKDGLFIIRINRDEGSLCDVFVVDEVELKRENQSDALRFALEDHVVDAKYAKGVCYGIITD